MGANLFIFLQKNTIQEKKPTQISMKHQSSKTTQQESKSSWNVRKKIFKHFKSCILFSHLSWCNFCSGNDFIHKTVVLCQHISSQLLQLDFDVFFWHICQGQCFHLTKKILNDLFTFLKWSEGKKEENKTEYLDYFQKLFSKLYHKYKVLFSTRNFLQEKKIWTCSCGPDTRTICRYTDIRSSVPNTSWSEETMFSIESSYRCSTFNSSTQPQ